MKLVWTVVIYLLKNVKHGTEHDIDSTERAHYTFLKCTADLMNTLQFKQMMNLTVC